MFPFQLQENYVQTKETFSKINLTRPLSYGFATSEFKSKILRLTFTHLNTFFPKQLQIDNKTTNLKHLGRKVLQKTNKNLLYKQHIFSKEFLISSSSIQEYNLFWVQNKNIVYIFQFLYTPMEKNTPYLKLHLLILHYLSSQYELITNIIVYAQLFIMFLPLEHA